MPEPITFSVSVNLENPETLEELQGRMEDLSPAFEQIFLEWTELNEQKFRLAKGAETSGVDVFGASWLPLTERYRQRKHPGGAPKRRRASTGEYPDWLMVRTGALMSAMTDPDALFSEITEQEAAFGMPQDEDLDAVILGNFRRRQIIFLGSADMNMINRIIDDYFSLGGNFKEIRFAKGLQSARNRRADAQAEIDFSNTINPNFPDMGAE